MWSLLLLSGLLMLSGAGRSPRPRCGPAPGGRRVLPDHRRARCGAGHEARHRAAAGRLRRIIRTCRAAVFAFRVVSPVHARDRGRVPRHGRSAAAGRLRQPVHLTSRRAGHPVGRGFEYGSGARPGCWTTPTRWRASPPSPRSRSAPTGVWPPGSASDRSRRPRSSCAPVTPAPASCSCSPPRWRSSRYGGARPSSPSPPSAVVLLVNGPSFLIKERYGDDAGVSSGRVETWRQVETDWRHDSLTKKLLGNTRDARPPSTGPAAAPTSSSPSTTRRSRRCARPAWSASSPSSPASACCCGTCGGAAGTPHRGSSCSPPGALLTMVTNEWLIGGPAARCGCSCWPARPPCCSAHPVRRSPPLTLGVLRGVAPRRRRRAVRADGLQRVAIQDDHADQSVEPGASPTRHPAGPGSRRSTGPSARRSRTPGTARTASWPGASRASPR